MKALINNIKLRWAARLPRSIPYFGEYQEDSEISVEHFGRTRFIKYRDVYVLSQYRAQSPEWANEHLSYKVKAEILDEIFRLSHEYYSDRYNAYTEYEKQKQKEAKSLESD